jgi:hypothetical protein
MTAVAGDRGFWPIGTGGSSFRGGQSEPPVPLSRRAGGGVRLGLRPAGRGTVRDPARYVLYEHMPGLPKSEVLCFQVFADFGTGFSCQPMVIFANLRVSPWLYSPIFVSAHGYIRRRARPPAGHSRASRSSSSVGAVPSIIHRSTSPSMAIGIGFLPDSQQE